MVHIKKKGNHEDKKQLKITCAKSLTAWMCLVIWKRISAERKAIQLKCNNQYYWWNLIENFNFKLV